MNLHLKSRACIHLVPEKNDIRDVGSTTDLVLGRTISGLWVHCPNQDLVSQRVKICDLSINHKSKKAGKSVNVSKSFALLVRECCQ